MLDQVAEAKLLDKTVNQYNQACTEEVQNASVSALCTSCRPKVLTHC